VDDAIDAHYRSSVKAQSLVAGFFSTVEFAAAVATAGVVVLGVMLGVSGELSAGTVVAFLFLVTLFLTPLATASEVLNEAQNALASFRRVLDILDTEPDVADPGDSGVELPSGSLSVNFQHVHFAYGNGPEVLADIHLGIEPGRRVAVVGETGSGKTTIAKLLTRLMDPKSGTVRVGGVPLNSVRFDSLRDRVVMVPQDGFLFDATIADNVRYGRPDRTDEQVERAFAVFYTWTLGGSALAAPLLYGRLGDAAGPHWAAAAAAGTALAVVPLMLALAPRLGTERQRA